MRESRTGEVFLGRQQEALPGRPARSGAMYVAANLFLVALSAFFLSPSLAKDENTEAVRARAAGSGRATAADAPVASRVVVYPAPDFELPSADYAVSVNGQPVFCYGSHQFDPASGTKIVGRSVSPISFASFDFQGPVTVTVRFLPPLREKGIDTTTVTVRPLAHGIRPAISKGVFSFTLTRPCQLSIEPGGGLRHPLHLFANPMEVNQPDRADSNVLYFGPGYHEIPTTEIPGGKTVYIAGGAVVALKPVGEQARGQESTAEGQKVWSVPAMFTSRNQSKVAIRGRGILCGRKALEHRQRGSLIRLDSGEDLYVEGIIIRESAEWSLNIRNAQNVHVDNVKVVGHYVNNDGIAIGGTSDAVVENSFCHNADDAFEIKVWQRQKNVLFRNCVAWATVAGAFGVCGEVMADLSQVVFEDCTVLHATSANTARGVIGLHLVWGTGSVEDVIFRNVVIEQVVGKRHCPIKVFNNWDSWNVNRPTLADDPHTLLNPPPRRDRPGRIRRIEFHNISVLETENPEVVVYANGPESPIEDIIFDRVSIAGENLRAGSPLIKTNRWVSGVTVK